MPFKKLGDVQLYYEHFGQGDDVIFISGLSADHNAWVSVTPQLAEKFRVTVFDNRGVGRSDVSKGNYTVQMLAEDVSSLMDGLDIKSAHVIGHSMGGMIAQTLALIAPCKIQSLCIICSKASFYPRSNAWLSLTETLLKAGGDIQLLAKYSYSYLFSNRFMANPENAKMWLKLVKENPYPQTLAGFSGQLYAANAHHVLDDLVKIKANTLVLAGEDDILTPPFLSKEIQIAIPNAKLELLPSGHMPMLECHELLTQ